MRERITEHTHGRIGRLPATALCGNPCGQPGPSRADPGRGDALPVSIDFTSSCLVGLGAGDHAIGSPTGHFMYGLAELGGVRLII